MATTKEILEATQRMQDRAKNLLYESARRLVEAEETRKVKNVRKSSKRRSSVRQLNESDFVSDTEMLIQYLNEHSLVYFDTESEPGDVVVEGAAPSKGNVEWILRKNVLYFYVPGDIVGAYGEDFDNGNVNELRCNLYFPAVQGFEYVSEALKDVRDVYCYVTNPDNERDYVEIRVLVAQPDSYEDDETTVTDYEFTRLFTMLAHSDVVDDRRVVESKRAKRTRKIQETVASRFARYRKMYESDEEDEDEEDDKDDDSDAFSFDELDDDTDSKDSKKKDDSDEEEEDIPMTAVVLTVAKDDAEKCKDEMVDAGIEEDDIEILDSEDDDETTEIKVDANSVMALKDYLEAKGIDLEEKIGGEIVDDSEESKDEDSESDDEPDLGDFDEDDIDDLFADDDEDSDDSDDEKE